MTTTLRQADLHPERERYPIALFPHSTIELVRQMLWQRFLYEHCGGLIPEHLDLSTVKRVLDLGCGSGWWATEMAFTHQDMELIGIDHNAYFIDNDRCLARAGATANVSFLVEDLYNLNLPDAQPFDLLNLAFLGADIPLADFPLLLQQWLPLCRTGGSVRWMELERVTTNSIAFHILANQLLEGFAQAGLYVGAETQPPTYLSSMMRPWLVQSGCTICANHLWQVDISCDAPAYNRFRQQVQKCLHQAHDFLLGTGVLEANDYERLYWAVMRDMAGASFRGRCELRCVVGKISDFVARPTP